MRKIILSWLFICFALIAAWGVSAQTIGEAFWKVTSPATPPNTIFGSGLFAWYKADTGVTLSGSNVTGWADQSGNGFNMSQVSQNGTAQTSPTFSATGFNSHAGISVADGSTQGLASSAANLNSNQFAFFEVMNPTVKPGLGYYNPASENMCGIADGGLHMADVSSALNAFYAGGQVFSPGASYSPGTNYRLGTVGDHSQPRGGNGWELYVNRALGAGSTNQPGTWGNASSAITFGAIYCGGPVLTNGQTIAEYVVVKGGITSAQISNLDVYFRSKWGL